MLFINDRQVLRNLRCYYFWVMGVCIYTPWYSDSSLTDISLMDFFPTGSSPKSFPQQTVLQLTVPQKDSSQKEHFPKQTFPWYDISPTHVFHFRGESDWYELKAAKAVFILFQDKYLKPKGRKSHLLTRSDNALHINVGGINSVVTSMKNY